MSDDRLSARLRHMQDAAARVADYVGRGRESFDRDPAILDAILYQIIIIGEAAKAALDVDPALEETIPDVAWSPMARMRDLLTHHYWATDREIVWSTASNDVPKLARLLESATRSRPG